jgi:hypothetical protein
MIKIVCTNCSKPLSLDETKLPTNKEVVFPCPVCKTKLTVDRRNLEGAAAEVPAPVAPSAAAHDPHHEGHVDDDDGFGSKAMIVGADAPLLRQAAKLIGYMPVVMATPQQARDYFMQEFPQVVFLHPAQVTPPPLQDFAPIVSLTPLDRRKSFFVLVAENLRTLDGNAAFLYGVNLVVATKDLPQFPQIFKDAHTYHERLYAAMTSVAKQMNA